MIKDHVLDVLRHIYALIDFKSKFLDQPENYGSLEGETETGVRVKYELESRG